MFQAEKEQLSHIGSNLTRSILNFIDNVEGQIKNMSEVIKQRDTEIKSLKEKLSKYEPKADVSNNTIQVDKT